MTFKEAVGQNWPNTLTDYDDDKYSVGLAVF
jgi:hypothetical protein